MAKKEKIVVNCKTDNLKNIRSFVEDTLVSYQLNQEDIDLIVLAIDEICANLIIHSNGENEEETISLSIELKIKPSGIEFEITDSGHYFDYSSYVEPSLDDLISEKRQGGMGMMLVRKIMDKIEYIKDQQTNKCRLFKNLEIPA